MEYVSITINGGTPLLSGMSLTRSLLGVIQCLYHFGTSLRLCVECFELEDLIFAHLIAFNFESCGRCIHTAFYL
jgi:hypothetical protein